MYKVYCISYDLNKSGKDYKGLTDEIKQSPLWWWYLKSTWLISTTESAEQIWKRLSSHIDSDDSILIIQVTRNYSGWLPQKAWEWIKDNVK